MKGEAMTTQPNQDAMGELREAVLNACRLYHKNIAGDDEALRLIEDSVMQVLLLAEAFAQRCVEKAETRTVHEKVAKIHSDYDALRNAFWYIFVNCPHLWYTNDKTSYTAREVQLYTEYLAEQVMSGRINDVINQTTEDKT